jgi:hypothetical protein
MTFIWQYTMSTSSAEGAGRVSKSTVDAAMFWLALAKVEHCVPSRLMAAVIAPSPCSGGDEVYYYGPLCLERELAVVQFGQLGLNGRSLASEFALLLRCLALGIGLLSVGSCLLLLLIGLLLLRREPDVWLWYDSL